MPAALRVLILATLSLALVACGDDDGSGSSAAVLEPSGFFESDGLEIHYESWGAGRPLILVHGWGADTKRNWVDTGWVDALATERLVISLDVRGHGQSDKPYEAERYSYATMSRDVLALIDHFGIEQPDFLGYSMGAFMGAHILGHHGQRFGAMILGGIGDESEESAAMRFAIAAALRATDPSTITDPLAHAYRAYAAAEPNNDLEALAIAVLRMWPEGYPRALGGDGLARADNPVLIVNGGDDHPYVDSDHLFAAAIPGAQLLEIPMTNHLSAPFDPRFRQAVLAFLAAD